MAIRVLPEKETLVSLLDYDPSSGKIYWKPRALSMFPDERSGKIWNSRYAGKEAFTTTDGNGYRRGRVFDVPYLAHRLIWKMVHGSDPLNIDHIDGDPSNNRICNLRSVDVAENNRNQKMHSTNTSGVTGVCPTPPSRRGRRRWEARIGKELIGCFLTVEEATAARRKAEIQHGYHPNHGRQ